MEKVVLQGMFDGLTTKKDGLVDIKFKFVSDELINCLSIFRLYHKNVGIAIKVEDVGIALGEFRVSGFTVDKEAQVKIKFTGLSSEIDTSRLATEAIGKNIKVRVQEVADV
jgi:hypothetical protein